MAPEMLFEHPHSYPCDLWSLGILLYIMLVAKMPFEGSAGINPSEMDDSPLDEDAAAALATFAGIAAYAHGQRTLDFPSTSAGPRTLLGRRAVLLACPYVGATRAEGRASIRCFL